jgi:hypothetical protein
MRMQARARAHHTFSEVRELVIYCAVQHFVLGLELLRVRREDSELAC